MTFTYKALAEIHGTHTLYYIFNTWVALVDYREAIYLEAFQAAHFGRLALGETCRESSYYNVDKEG